MQPVILVACTWCTKMTYSRYEQIKIIASIWSPLLLDSMACLEAIIPTACEWVAFLLYRQEMFDLLTENSSELSCFLWFHGCVVVWQQKNVRLSVKPILSQTSRVRLYVFRCISQLEVTDWVLRSGLPSHWVAAPLCLHRDGGDADDTGKEKEFKNRMRRKRERSGWVGGAQADREQTGSMSSCLEGGVMPPQATK